MQIIQIMDGRKDKLRIDDLVMKLQRHKGEIMRDEQRAKQDMKAFFKDLTDSLMTYESQIIKRFDEEILNFHEGTSKTINFLSKMKNNATEQSIENAQEISKCQVINGSKIEEEKLKQLLKEVYYLKIGAFHEDSKVQLPEMQESRASFEEKMYSESSVQKLQNERDYYQRREEELQLKIKELQFNRKGTNIRDLSKSALEQKCSRWAIQRLKEQKRVLIQKIGEASQQIMKQDGLLSYQQDQIRKLTSIVNQISGRSVAGSSIIKNASMVLQSQINHEHQLELQSKNAQLTLELTNYMHRLEEIYQANKQYQSQLQAKIKENQNLQFQIVNTKKECLLINNDYEENLRKKTLAQHQYNEMKKKCDEYSAKLQQERQSYKGMVEGLEAGQKEIKQRLKRMDTEKKAEIQSIQQKLIASQLEREKLLKKLDEMSSKNGDQSNYKQLLNDQITRLLKQNANLEKQLHVKEELTFDAKEESKRLEAEIRQQAKRGEISKKQCVNLKKTNKQLEKQISQLRNRVSANENLQIKILQLQQHFTTLHNEFIKYKETSEKRSNQQEKTMAIMKQRFNLHISQLLNDQNKKLKRQKQNKSQLIDKYIEEMMTFSSKTAQIKQLKQQVRDLKDKQGAKQLKKRQKSSLQQSVSTLEWGMWAANSKIFQQRLKSQKQLFEERINEMAELCKKQETAKNSLNQQLQKERATTVQLKNKQKQQKNTEQSNKNAKQLEDKIERLQQQAKRLKARNKKLEIDISDAQSQLKTKKQLNIGLKNQTKLKEDTIIQLYKQIDDLKNQISKQQRNTRQMSNKQELLKESKEAFKKMEDQYRQLVESLEDMTEKNKQLARQLSKKDEVIKQLGFIQQKQVKRKEDTLIKSLNNDITDLKETVRKLKIDNDRKDQIIKNNKNKLENKNKENQELVNKTQKQCDKLSKEKDNLQRKLDSMASTLKKEQLKTTNLSYTIKKIFEMCCQTSTIQYERQTTKNKPLTTQYYTNSSVSPNTLKLGTPASNIKSYISCQGLDILNLRPQDIQQCLGVQVTTLNKSQIRNQSWSMASPIINKRKEYQKKQLLMDGLEELQRLLNSKQMSSASLIEQFKKILEK